MRFVVVTGMSGAGKSTALKYMEDIGYFCIDNLPPTLIPKFAEVCLKAGEDIDKVALGIDIRGGRLFSDLIPALEELGSEYQYTILFLDSSDDVLIKRYKESRRSHPLARKDSILSGIEKERDLLSNIKAEASYIIDTSQLLSRQLKEQINNIFVEEKLFSSLMITVMSFGYKYGIPQDADLVFDVRFIPNPFYISDLKEKTGNNKEVQDYVLSWETSTTFLDKANDMIEFLIPNYISEGKNQLVIAIGCTGGKHRSVTLAIEIYNALQRNGQSVIMKHRDIDKDSRSV